MKRFFLLLLMFSVLGCGEGEQPFDATEIEDEESMDSKENLINGIKVIVNGRTKDHEEVVERLTQRYIKRELHDLEYKLVEESARFVVDLVVLESRNAAGEKTGDVSISYTLLKRHMDQECYSLSFFTTLGNGPRNGLRELCVLLVSHLDEDILELKKSSKAPQILR